MRLTLSQSALQSLLCLPIISYKYHATGGGGKCYIERFQSAFNSKKAKRIEKSIIQFSVRWCVTFKSCLNRNNQMTKYRKGNLICNRENGFQKCFIFSASKNILFIEGIHNFLILSSGRGKFPLHWRTFCIFCIFCIFCKQRKTIGLWSG